MAAVRDLLAGAMRLVGALDPGEAMEPTAARDALQVLNDLIETLNLEHLTNPTGTNRVDVTCTAGRAVHTIGAGGDFDTTRPVVIERAFVVLGAGEYPVDVLDDEEWSAIPIKGIQGIPERLFYEPGMPLGSVYLWPKPAQPYTLALWVWDSLPAYASINDTLVLPPGYARMLRYNLAVELGPEYGKQPSDVVVHIAAESLASVKRANQSTPALSVDPAMMPSSGSCGTNMAGFLGGR